ncbi:hypothetical protein SpCBS45565_g04277 [Spizellomyces sp. 'palustris']|nr:hypothetical protein SpCBS45565_g04277 [Spizellomyces sp. 'palustris']
MDEAQDSLPGSPFFGFSECPNIMDEEAPPGCYEVEDDEDFFLSSTPVLEDEEVEPRKVVPRPQMLEENGEDQKSEGSVYDAEDDGLDARSVVSEYVPEEEVFAKVSNHVDSLPRPIRPENFGFKKRIEFIVPEEDGEEASTDGEADDWVVKRLEEEEPRKEALEKGWVLAPNAKDELHRYTEELPSGQVAFTQKSEKVEADFYVFPPDLPKKYNLYKNPNPKDRVEWRIEKDSDYSVDPNEYGFRQYREVMQRLRKDNINLKMRIFFEERSYNITPTQLANLETRAYMYRKMYHALIRERDKFDSVNEGLIRKNNTLYEELRQLRDEDEESKMDSAKANEELKKINNSLREDLSELQMEYERNGTLYEELRQRRDEYEESKRDSAKANEELKKMNNSLQGDLSGLKKENEILRTTKTEEINALRQEIERLKKAGEAPKIAGTSVTVKWRKEIEELQEALEKQQAAYATETTALKKELDREKQKSRTSVTARDEAKRPSVGSTPLVEKLKTEIQDLKKTIKEQEKAHLLVKKDLERDLSSRKSVTTGTGHPTGPNSPPVVGKLKKEIDALKQTMKDKEKSYMLHVSSLKRESETSQNELAKKVKETAELERQLRNSAAQIESKEASIGQLTRDLQNLRENLASLKQARQVAGAASVTVSDVEKLKKEIEALKQTAKDAEKSYMLHVSSLKKASDTAHDELAEKGKETAELERQLRNSAAQIETEQNELAKKVRESAELERKLRDSAAETESKEAHIDQLTRDLQNLRENLASLKQARQVAGAASVTVSDVEKLKKEIEALKQTAKDAEKSYMLHVSSLKKASDTAHDELAEKVKETAELERQLRNSAAQIESKDANINQLAQDLQTLRENLSNVNQSKQEGTTPVTVSGDVLHSNPFPGSLELLALQAELEIKNSQLAAVLENDYAHVTSLLEQIQLEVEGYKEEIWNFQTANETTAQDMMYLRRELEVQTRTIFELEAKWRDESAAKQAKEEQNKRELEARHQEILLEETAELKERIEELTQELRQTQLRLEEAENGKYALQEQQQRILLEKTTNLKERNDQLAQELRQTRLRLEEAENSKHLLQEQQQRILLEKTTKLKDRNEQLTQELHQTQLRVEKTDKEKRELQEQHQRILVEKTTRVKDLNERLTQELHQTQLRLEKADKDKCELQDQHQRILGEKTKLRDRNEQLTQDLRQGDVRLAEARRNIENIKAELKTKIEMIDRLESTIRELQRQGADVELLKQKIRDIEKDKSTKERALEQAKSTIRDLQDDASRDRKMYSEQKERFLRHIKDCEGAMLTVSQQLQVILTMNNILQTIPGVKFEEKPSKNFEDMKKQVTVNIQHVNAVMAHYRTTLQKMEKDMMKNRREWAEKSASKEAQLTRLEDAARATKESTSALEEQVKRLQLEHEQKKGQLGVTDRKRRVRVDSLETRVLAEEAKAEKETICFLQRRVEKLENLLHEAHGQIVSERESVRIRVDEVLRQKRSMEILYDKMERRVEYMEKWKQRHKKICRRPNSPDPKEMEEALM